MVCTPFAQDSSIECRPLSAAIQQSLCVLCTACCTHVARPMTRGPLARPAPVSTGLARSRSARRLAVDTSRSGYSRAVESGCRPHGASCHHLAFVFVVFVVAPIQAVVADPLLLQVVVLGGGRVHPLAARAALHAARLHVVGEVIVRSAPAGFSRCQHHAPSPRALPRLPAAATRRPAAARPP